VALVIKSAIYLGIDWTPPRLLMLAVGVLSGGFIFIALNLITCVTAFWIVDSVPITRLVFDNHLFAQYPLSIYPRVISILLTLIIPYGFASFYPASYVLNREVGNIAWLGPFVAALLLFLGYRFWQFGLKHYSGTGT
jgi:ABC-2 type transport system permease protein